MIQESLLLRNKKIADYALSICEENNVSVEYNGLQIYSYLLLFNRYFFDINLSDDLEVESAYKASSNIVFKYKPIFFTDIEEPYYNRICLVIFKSILHFDKNGNFISFEQKLKEIEDLFGKHSFIYDKIKEIILIIQ